MKSKADILAVFSYGGHMVQWEIISSSFSQYNICHVSTKATETQYSVIDCNIRTPLRLILCFFQCVFLILKLRPQIIISTGAAPGAMALLAGFILRKKTIWIDSLANYDILSVSGRFVSYFCSHCFTQWEHLENKKVNFVGSII